MPPYATDTAAGRHAAAAAGANTLGLPSGRPQLLWPDGTPISDADFENIRKYGAALSDEDARRFEVGQSNIVAGRQQTAQEHADAVKQAKQLLKQRQYEFDYQNGPNSLNERTFNEGNRRFDTTTGVGLLGQEAQNRGALNFVQGDMLAQGATRLSPWLQSLRTGEVGQYGGGTATGMNPTPLTNMTLANQYAGGGGPAGALIAQAGAPATPSGVGSVARPAAAGRGVDQYGRPLLSPDVQAAVDAGSEAFTSGLSNKPLGWYENQSDAQKQGLRSIGDYLGRNTEEDLQYLRRSRPGQGNAASA